LQELVKSPACIQAMQSCKQFPGALQRLQIWTKGFTESPSVSDAARNVLDALLPSAPQDLVLDDPLCPYCRKTLDEGPDSIACDTCKSQRYCSVPCREQHWKLAHRYICGASMLHQGANDAERCDECGIGGVKLLLCSGCRAVKYCNKDCQVHS